MRRSADMRPDGHLQFRADLLEHLDLSGLHDLRRYVYLRPAGNLRGHSDLWRIHDLHRDSAVQPDAVSLSVSG